MEKLHSDVRRQVRLMQDTFIGISSYLFQNPELGDEEHKAAAYLTGLLRDAGFEIECPYKGVATAFRADKKMGEGLCVGFLAEYDALPGYGPEKKPAHACGHNWIAATTVGAALALAAMPDKFKGTVSVFGCPAEETTGRKADLANAGAFENVDAAFQFHLNEETNLGGRALAMNAAEFVFTGRSAHAAAYPQDGINALDAVLLTFNGINCLRQQLSDDVRIHGIITQGGEAANTIPNLAKALFYVRAARKPTFLDAFEKVLNCARGAAVMTGATLTINYPENQFDDLMVNPVYSQMITGHMLASGLALTDTVEKDAGSTDVGNVSYACPTLYGNVGVGKGVALVHEEGFVPLADGDEARRHLLETVECFACACIELSQKPETVKAARKAFLEGIGG